MTDRSHDVRDDIVSSEALEAAFDSVVDKIRDFYATLPPDEGQAFMELLESAREHTDWVQARDEGELDKIVYEKPIQVHATYAMKRKMKELPDLVGRS